jgi:hypothetical protein
MIEEFDKYDPSSQASRYPIDKNGNPTLAGLELIDLPRALALGVHKISHYLDAVMEQIGEDQDWE